MKKIILYLIGNGLHHRAPNCDICKPAHSPNKGCYTWTYINGLKANTGRDRCWMYKALPVEQFLLEALSSHSIFLNIRTSNSIQVQDDIEPLWNIHRHSFNDHIAPLADSAYLEIRRYKKEIVTWLIAEPCNGNNLAPSAKLDMSYSKSTCLLDDFLGNAYWNLSTPRCLGMKWYTKTSWIMHISEGILYIKLTCIHEIQLTWYIGCITLKHYTINPRMAYLFM